MSALGLARLTGRLSSSKRVAFASEVRLRMLSSFRPAARPRCSELDAARFGTNALGYRKAHPSRRPVHPATTIMNLHAGSVMSL